MQVADDAPRYRWVHHRNQVRPSLPYVCEYEDTCVYSSSALIYMRESEETYMWTHTHTYASQAGVPVGCVAELVSLKYIYIIYHIHHPCIFLAYIQALELTVATAGLSCCRQLKPSELTVAYSQSSGCRSPESSLILVHVADSYM